MVFVSAVKVEIPSFVLKKFDSELILLKNADLGLRDGHEVYVSDETLSQAVTCRLKLQSPPMDTK